MLKKVLIGSLVASVAALAVVFAWLNPAMITLDLAFATFEVSVALAVTVGLVVGWLFGLSCTAFYILNLLRQRRMLRKSLRLAETEVSNLRELPSNDAG